MATRKKTEGTKKVASKTPVRKTTITPSKKKVVEEKKEEEKPIPPVIPEPKPVIEVKMEDIVEKGDLLWWRLNNNKSYRHKGSIIKPGQRFQARDSEIPLAFRDVIICIDPPERVAEVRELGIKKMVAVTPDFEVRPGKEEGKFDIVSLATGKIQNESPLEEKEAKDFCSKLNS